jgi:ABC-2 type transport system permease protein
MKILWRIIRHDWRNLNADRSLLVFYVLCLALVAYGIYNGKAQTLKHHRIAARLAPAMENQINEWQRQLLVGLKVSPDPANPYAISAQRQEVVLPPAPLALLSTGQSDLYPINAKAYMWSSFGVMWAKSELQNPVNLQAGRFDLAFVVVWLFPLLILALSHNLLSAEREDGTLALLLSQPISLLQVILGKAIARGVAAIGGFIVIGWAGLLLAGVRLTSLKIGGGLLVWAALVASYGLFWLALAVLVNQFQHGSARNALTLAGAWVLLVFVAPSLIGSLAAARYPIPPRAELIIADREAEPNTDRDGESALATFRRENPTLQPAAPTIEISERRRQLLAVFLKNNRAFERAARRYDDQLTGQQQLVNRLSFFSPPIVLQATLNDLAGTGFNRFSRFRAQVWQWVEGQRAFFIPRIMRGERLTGVDYEQLPRFRFAEAGLAQTIQPLLSNLGSLGTSILLLLLVALRRLKSSKSSV